MADSKTYTISTITRGVCLETRANNTVSTGTYDSNGSTKAQLWTIEENEDQTSIAFRNVANGEYLRTGGKGDGAKAQTGAKSWWTPLHGDSPGSWWLKNNDTENYLNNYYGYQTPNNTVQMWSTNLSGWSYTLQWYINDAKPSPSFSSSEGGGDSAELKKQKDEMEAKEKALKEREETLSTREKELSNSEAVTKKQKADLEAKEKTLGEMQQKLEAREQAVAGKEADSKKPAGGSKDTSSEQTAKLQQRIKELEDEIANNRTSSFATPVANPQEERPRMKPIVVQKGFGFLPRLTDAKLDPPSNTPPRLTSVR